MKTQIPLLVLYLIFLVGTASFVMTMNHLVESTAFAPGSFDRMREGVEHVDSLAAARQHMIGYIGLMESSERAQSDITRIYGYFAAFAVIITLPLAAYTGQSMRAKLFEQRPANMPRLVYWTLWGVNDRSSAVRYMWLSVVLALVSIASSFINPVGFLGTAALISAALYRRAIDWVDRRSTWDRSSSAETDPR